MKKTENTTKHILLTAATLLTVIALQAQEQLSGLVYNPMIKDALKTEANATTRSLAASQVPVLLPIFDDFHTDDIFPDTAYYSDSYAFVNDDFAYRSVNVGVATLDAIDETGNIYPDASPFPFVADHLTSRPIRLDSLFLPNETRAITLADSIYFSFYYQPQGLGNPPEEEDSLVLQFGYYGEDSLFAYMDSIYVSASSYLHDENDTIFPLDTIYAPPECDPGVYMISFDTIVWGDVFSLPCDSVFEPQIEWKNVWSTAGMDLQTFYDTYNTYSRQVIIPVDDSARYYKKNFFFRFFNYASLANDILASWRSNCDQWNIDYIYLDVNRSAADTFYRTITFAERAPSFLTKYTSMPLRQYRNDPTNQLKDSLEIYITNLSADTFNVYYEYMVDERGGAYTHTYNGGFANLYPFYNSGYQSCEEVPQHACPPRDFLFPLSSQADSISFNIRHVVHDQSNPDLGDTIHFVQKFYNYYAYDDGTPELGYGLSLAEGKTAVRYTLNIADSLKGIGMFFNRVQDDQNDQFFNLKVWDNNNGKPGNLIWEMTNLKPVFSEELNRMYIYKIDPPVALVGTIFIGFEQTTSDILNVGLDKNYDGSDDIFFNTDGTWQPSTAAGALLMRPIFYQYYDPFAVEEYEEISWSVYPNPVDHGQLNILTDRFSENELQRSGTRIFLYDLLGRPVLESGFNHIIAVDHLSKGMYILHIINESRSINYTHKVLINN